MSLLIEVTILGKGNCWSCVVKKIVSLTVIGSIERLLVVISESNILLEGNKSMLSLTIDSGGSQSSE